MDQLPSILVVGAPQVGKITVIKQLQPASAAPKPVVHSTASCGEARLAGACQLRLDTKYYTADAAVHISTIASKQRQPQEHQQLLQHEAVVIVCDANDPASFDLAQRWASAHDTSAAEVRLLVANKVDQMPAHASAALPAAAGWCLDQGFEYIEAAAGAPGVDASLSIDGDTQGMARVREALEAHMWPGLVRKPGPGAATAAAGTAATIGAAAEGVPGGTVLDDTRDQGRAAGGAAAVSGAAVASGAAAVGGAAAAAHTAASDGAAAAGGAVAAQQGVDSGGGVSTTAQGTTAAEPAAPPTPQAAAEAEAAAATSGGTAASGSAAAEKGAHSGLPAEPDLEANVESFEQLMQQLQGKPGTAAGQLHLECRMHLGLQAAACVVREGTP